MYDTPAPTALPSALSDCFTVLVCKFSERIILRSSDGANAMVRNLTTMPTRIIPIIANIVISFMPTVSAA